MIGLGFFVAMGWGLTFVLTKGSVDHFSPLLFVSLRFLVAAVVLAPLLIWSLLYTRGLRSEGGTLARPSLDWLTPRSVLKASFVGLFLFVGYLLQSIALKSVAASQAGFIMGLAPVMVPFLAILVLGTSLPSKAWFGVVLVMVGLPLLSLDSELAFTSGTLYCILSAVFFAFHVVLLQESLKKIPIVPLTFIQIFSTGVLSLGAVAFFEPSSLNSISGIALDRQLILSLLVCGVGATGLATLIQCYLQQNLNIVKCALIFSTEPVFAAAFGYLLLDEQLSALQSLGGGLVFIGVVEAELGLIVFACNLLVNSVYTPTSDD